MTPKERAVMQQALEALESCNVGAWNMAFDEFAVVEAITALREALAAEPKLTEDNISYHKLEQEPVGYVDEALRIKWLIDYDAVSKLTGHKLYAAPAQQAEQEPVAWCYFCEDALWGFFTDPDECDSDCDNEMPLYAAPVRTKDLTDDEIMKINVDTAGIVPTCDRQFHFARAVIAADRELNK